MQIRLFLRGLGIVAGLFLASALALPIQAAEPKPVLTVSTASPETLYKIAEKIATLVGTLDDFNEVAAPFKNLKGINPNNPILFVIHSDGDEFKDPLLFLPITDFEAVEIPGIEMLQAMAQKEGTGKYLFNSPVGAFILTQKQGYLVVSSESSDMPIPDDPAKFIKGLEDFSIGFRFDVENTSVDAIQMLLAPMRLAAMMQGGVEVMRVFDQLDQQVEMMCEEFSTMTIGLAMDPQTGDVNLQSSVVLKPGSGAAKSLSLMKNAETAFSGFLGGENAVATLSSAGAGGLQGQAATREVLENQINQWIEGLLEQVEENAEDEDDIELAEAVAASFKKIYFAMLDADKSDFGLSLGSDGTAALGITLTEAKELEKIGSLMLQRIEKLAPSSEEFQRHIMQRMKTHYATVDGFQLSSFVFPFGEIADEEPVPPFLADKTFYAYWGLKDDAFVLLAGFDPKSEDLFKQAIAAMKKPVACQIGAKLSMLQLGKLLKHFELDQASPELDSAVKVFLAAGADANITMSMTIEKDSAVQSITVSGKILDAIAKIIRDLQ